jgi:undecaprenyl diphosphate synthase
MSNTQCDRPLSSSSQRLHVAIIMDGSGRWAVTRAMSRAEGHRAGRAAVVRTIAAARVQGVHTLTLFTFSTENWGRPHDEVAELMRTFEDFFHEDAPAIASKGVRISVMGRRDRLPSSLLRAIEKVEAVSIGEECLHVRFAIDYSGREAILSAARRFDPACDEADAGFARLLAETDPGEEPTPDVDLLIRTGGELRLSNCPLWEIAYAELYFTACLWPDFGANELNIALQEFYTRHRRFGRIPAEESPMVVE